MILVHHAGQSVLRLPGLAFSRKCGLAFPVHPGPAHPALLQGSPHALEQRSGNRDRPVIHAAHL
jgi:hypothetical protein